MIAFIVFLPLFAATYVGLTTSFISQKQAQVITTGSMVLSAVFAAIVFFEYVINRTTASIELMRFIDVGQFKVSWVLNFDSLTYVMVLLVTVVSALVHIYSCGYMSHDEYVPRFMAYLSLFTFFMLMLVTSNNFIQLFLGWEGVGLCSYLLIGFWFKKQSACNAAIKAFVVNRVGDFGFLIAVVSIYLIFGSLNFAEVFAAVSEKTALTINLLGFEFNAINFICVFLFIGAMGKSAQIGLHTWLADAMEGPTPVSALIHAATMVTAGVFLVARCSPLFEHAETARSMVTLVGATTAIFAATIAITQNDIKRIIAYSTCSQLGYMFFACGVSAYAAGIFHLFTHGFFKALLFLGAGSVIHAVSGEQDIQKMGGLWRKIPQTYALMWIGSLALIGIFPFAGFYSKDIVLEAAYASGELGSRFGVLAYYLGISAAFLTAFYSVRLIILVFHGKPRAGEEVLHHVHESPFVMLFPLYILAIGAVLAGYVGYHIWGMVQESGSFYQTSLQVLEVNNSLEKAHHVPEIVKWSPLVVGFLGMFTAYLFYAVKTSLPGFLARNFSVLYKISFNKWYFDEIYNVIFVRMFKKLGSFFWRVVDVRFIDAFGPNGAAWASMQSSALLARLQTGFIYSYAFTMVVATLILIAWFL